MTRHSESVFQCFSVDVVFFFFCIRHDFSFRWTITRNVIYTHIYMYLKYIVCIFSILQCQFYSKHIVFILSSTCSWSLARRPSHSSSTPLLDTCQKENNNWRRDTNVTQFGTFTFTIKQICMYFKYIHRQFHIKPYTRGVESSKNDPIWRKVSDFCIFWVNVHRKTFHWVLCGGAHSLLFWSIFEWKITVVTWVFLNNFCVWTD